MVHVLIDHTAFTVIATAPHLCSTPCVLEVITATFHSLEVEHCHVKTTLSIAVKSDRNGHLLQFLSLHMKQTGNGELSLKGSVLCNTLVLSGPPLFSRCP